MKRPNTRGWFLLDDDTPAAQSVPGEPGLWIFIFGGAGWCCGLVFIILKLTEYGQKFNTGISSATNDFFMFYFVLTGIHFLHVVVGLAVIGYFWRRYASGRADGATAPRILKIACDIWIAALGAILVASYWTEKT